jgi:hypothetical protein
MWPRKQYVRGAMEGRISFASAAFTAFVVAGTVAAVTLARAHHQALACDVASPSILSPKEQVLWRQHLIAKVNQLIESWVATPVDRSRAKPRARRKAISKTQKPPL